MNYLKTQSIKILSCYIEKSNIAFIGEIREYGGRKYQKQASGKWKSLTNAVASSNKGELTNHDINEINYYTSQGYHTLNGFLRTGKNFSRLSDKDLEDRVNNINNALDKLPSYKGEVTRWMPFFKGDFSQHIDDFVKGDLVQLPEFLSTTRLGKSPDTIRTNDIKIVIDSKNGKDVSEFSSVPDEQEVLFKSGSVFEVKSVKVKKGIKPQIIVRLKEI